MDQWGRDGDAVRVASPDCDGRAAPTCARNRRDFARPGLLDRRQVAPGEAGTVIGVAPCRRRRRRARSSTRCPRGCATSCPRRPRRAAALARQVLDRFALHGYALVTLPAFEFAEVLERGLGTLDPADVLRFVEPESGEVAALAARHDAADRAHDRDAPAGATAAVPPRLRGHGAPRGAAGARASSRQIPQVGVELAGVAGPEGDIELLALAAEALRGGGARAIHARRRRRRDRARAARVAPAGGAGAPVGRDGAQGRRRRSTIRRCGRSRRCRAAATPSSRARACSRARRGRRRGRGCSRSSTRRSRAGLGAHLAADLGEVRGFAYYTGTIFHAYARGHGRRRRARAAATTSCSRASAARCPPRASPSISTASTEALRAAGVRPSAPRGASSSSAPATIRARAPSCARSGVAAVAVAGDARGRARVGARVGVHARARRVDWR